MVQVLVENETAVSEATVTVRAESIQQAVDRATTKYNTNAVMAGKVACAERYEVIKVIGDEYTIWFH